MQTSQNNIQEKDVKKFFYMTSGRISGETLKLQDVDAFFRYAINPFLIESKIEYGIQAGMRDRSKINPMMLLMFGGLILAAVVAYNMLSQNNSVKEWTVKYVNCQTSLAQCKSPVYTGQSETSSQTNQNSNILPPIGIK